VEKAPSFPYAPVLGDDSPHNVSLRGPDVTILSGDFDPFAPFALKERPPTQNHQPHQAAVFF
jgi:hypothetical protein